MSFTDKHLIIVLIFGRGLIYMTKRQLAVETSRAFALVERVGKQIHNLNVKHKFIFTTCLATYLHNGHGRLARHRCRHQ